METKGIRFLFLKIMIVTAVPLIFMGAAFALAVVFFSQRLPEDVKNMFWDTVVSTMWIWLIILVAVMIIILFCTMYMAGAIIRHFKDEEKANSDRFAAKTKLRSAVRRRPREAPTDYQPFTK